MTPLSVASFMASMFPAPHSSTCRLLDGGAGMGSLTAAFLDHWKKGGFSFKHVSVSAFEVDEAMQWQLEKNMRAYTRMPSVAIDIHRGDFIEHAVGALSVNLFSTPTQPYTHAILNPPYKKINSSSRHRHLLREVGIETVNLYSAFVALSLLLLGPKGMLVAIIPRSFCNGPYYRPFRDLIFRHSAIRRIHIFGSRTTAFKHDNVLQENIIIMLEKGATQSEVLISSSTDDTLGDYHEQTVPFDEVVKTGDPEKFIHIPARPIPGDTVQTTQLKYSLADIGVEVSTGPVVDFRMREHIREMPESGTVPLLYPSHFKDGMFLWPKPDGKKPNALMDGPEVRKWLFPKGFYTVVRRFSSKEEKRRIVASVLDPARLPRAENIGIENHLNVFHTHKTGLPEDLSRGLAVFLNSTASDRCFRAFNGHTQVNATDLRSMKYPSREELVHLGIWAKHRSALSQNEIDKKVEVLFR